MDDFMFFVGMLCVAGVGVMILYVLVIAVLALVS